MKKPKNTGPAFSDPFGQINEHTDNLYEKIAHGAYNDELLRSIEDGSFDRATQVFRKKEDGTYEDIRNKCKNCLRLECEISFLKSKLELIDKIVSPLPDDYKPEFKDPMFKQDIK